MAHGFSLSWVRVAGRGESQHPTASGSARPVRASARALRPVHAGACSRKGVGFAGGPA